MCSEHVSNRPVPNLALGPPQIAKLGCPNAVALVPASLAFPYHLTQAGLLRCPPAFRSQNWPQNSLNPSQPHALL